MSKLLTALLVLGMVFSLTAQTTGSAETKEHADHKEAPKKETPKKEVAKEMEKKTEESAPTTGETAPKVEEVKH